MPDEITPIQFREAQRKLGLSDADLAQALATTAQNVRRFKIVDQDKGSARTCRGSTARLLRYYLDGFRPDDWPES